MTISAPVLELTQGTQVNVSASGLARGGDVILRASDLNLQSSSVTTSTSGLKNGGTIRVLADHVLLDGRPAATPTGLFAETTGVFPTPNISVFVGVVQQNADFSALAITSPNRTPFLLLIPNISRAPRSETDSAVPLMTKRRQASRRQTLR